ncbi:hypothetical protein MSG37_06215 [Shewanella sp. 1CM18E]|nr:hypothetical protein [Shewanella sp. 1CM18E]MCK8044472.1 hypothetical protein [Shewanella sp. 1CM18E]
MFELGEGVVQNIPEAITWYTAAAEQGDAESQYVLGTIYESDNSEPQNQHIANKWYLEAAAQGHKEALAALMQNPTGAVIAH